ncbi:MAG TPA: solute carrier family 23 protein, partial [Terrimesophilobacter sp.]|nr:solute carrier family 23 protein [Terrimesophilobacter sp.]
PAMLPFAIPGLANLWLIATKDTALLAIVGIIVHFSGTGWINALLPAVVSGSIVALIGFALAPVAGSNFAASPWIALITLFAVILCAVVFKGILGRLSILIGVAAGYVAAVIAGEVNFDRVADAAWVGLPEFTTPVWDAQYLPIYLMFLPVVLALVAENVGHIKGVGQLINRDLDPLTGRALFADGAATVIAGFGGGSPTTTYGENIGVMAATKVFSTAAYWVAGIVAILLGLSPKVGEIINTIPPGVIGGVTTALYGLIGIIGVRIWVENKVDFARPKNQMTAGVALVMGIANYTLAFGEVKFEGIILGTVAAVVVYHLMNVIEKLRGTGGDARPPVALAETKTE